MPRIEVAVLCGGYSAEENISLLSGDVVFRSLDPEHYNATKVLVEKEGIFAGPWRAQMDMNDFSFTRDGKKIRFDVVFNAIHGSPGEDGRIQGYFDMLHIPYTNCGAATSALTFNKQWTKDVLHNTVAMAKGRLLKKHDDIAGISQAVQAEFALPVFVKPNNNGSSYGISKVTEFSQLGKALEEALRFDAEILIEEGLSGTEVTCGVYRYKDAVTVLPLCEIRPKGHDFFNYTAKYTSGESEEVVPAEIEEAAAENIRKTSVDIYVRLNCRGVVRIDYILDASGIPHFLEVNTVPGLSENSIVPRMAKAAGLGLPEFFGRLLEETLRKSAVPTGA